MSSTFALPKPSSRSLCEPLRSIPLGSMRIALISAVLVLFMALGVVGLALRQPPVKFDVAVLVRVAPDHYEIAGKRFEGSLADQLDRYAMTGRKVSILLIGSDTVVRAREPELSRLRSNPNIRIAVVTSHGAT
jgi:hypothetical protein